MVHIYTFCDKTLIGKKNNDSANFLSESLYKLNFKINEKCVFCNNFDFESLTIKNKDIYFMLLQKSNSKLNSFLAELINCELKENNNLKQTVINYYKNINIPMDQSAELESIIPQKAIEITNPNGKTQGYYLKINDAYVFVLPCDLFEFKTIFNDCLLQFIEENFTLEYDSETYSIFGLSEDSIKEILKEYIKNKDKITVSLFSKGLTSNIVIKSKKGNELFEKYRREIYNKLSSYIYSVQNLSLDEYINNMLTNNNAKIGLIGDVSINNFLNGLDEKIINENIISSIYLTNKNHIDYLGLNMQYNFNSDYVYQLAVKMLEKTKCEVVLASICNNNSSFIAIGDKKKIDIYKNNFVGNREEILYNISATSKFYLAKKLQLKDYKTI